ncbi:MAG: 4Fe-4S dicluster domain-containing protein [Deltaproteobacteria bacterium]|nr:4Fe-4S dicluster domain-containing protein [Deltaproteobacteria bacterium]MBW2532811.1 4Fe-4S dicluster domain-containing protein [Deltaproteobacteria bacterium]
MAGDSKAGTTERYPGYPGRFGLLHDTTLCVGCRTCEETCAELHGNPAISPPKGDPREFDQPRPLTDKTFTVVNRYQKGDKGKPAVYRKHQCMHCNEPCCASVCFTGAFKKTPEGPVQYDPSVCVGCRYCVMACPYYALTYEYDDPMTPEVVRCTMCLDRIREGKNPGCADACPTGAILFGEREKLLEVARERIRKNPDRYEDHIFGEHEFGGTSWLTLTGVPLRKLGLPENVSHEPLPTLTEGALSLVPVIVSAWPGLLLGMYAFSKRKEKLAKAELDGALAEAKDQAKAELDDALAKAATKAKKDKDKAVEQAASKAKAEAKKELEEAQKAEAGATEGEA